MAKELFTKAERADLADDFGGRRGVAAAVAAGDAPFCTAWPVTKAGLEALEKIAKRPLVKLAIRQSIELGEAAFDARCK